MNLTRDILDADFAKLNDLDKLYCFTEMHNYKLMRVLELNEQFNRTKHWWQRSKPTTILLFDMMPPLSFPVSKAAESLLSRSKELVEDLESSGE